MFAGATQGQSLAEARAESDRVVAIPGLAELYGKHFRYVWRCLRNLGVGDRELDDAIQDVFLVVHRRLPDFDGRRASPTTWLYAIALRIARRYKERYRRGARLDGLDEDPERDFLSPRDTEVECAHNERLAFARRALDTLDDNKREVFVLAQVEQMSASEIAEVTGLAVNTVYSRLRAARSAFAAEIQRLEAHTRRSA